MLNQVHPPLRSRLPWFLVWVPLLLLLYALINGAGHAEASFEASIGSVPLSEVSYVLQAARLLHGGWGLLLGFCLFVFAMVTWKLAPQWSTATRWCAGMVSLVILVLLILIQTALLMPNGMRAPLLPWKSVRFLLIQTWKPHSPWVTRVEDLACFLGNDDADVRRFAASYLARGHEPGVDRRYAPDVARLLSDPDGDVRAQAALSLYWMSAWEYYPQIVKLLADPDPRTRAAAVDAIGTPRDQNEKYASKIAKMLRDGNPTVRIFAARKLGDWKRKQYAPDIAELLTDVDPGVRAIGAYVLADLQAHEYVSRISALLADADPHPREMAVSALKRLGVDAPSQAPP